MSKATKDSKTKDLLERSKDLLERSKAQPSARLFKSEQEIGQFWKNIDAFQQTLRDSKDRPLFIFYDGPPFATGLPHYGHLVGSTLKDVVPRYKTMTGYHVPRKWGWDTHGLPIEQKMEEKFNLRSKTDIRKFGIARYNQECEKMVMTCSKEWEVTINRLGRWVDMENDYKTMDFPYMESVWWVFKRLWDGDESNEGEPKEAGKGLVYGGVKVMPYSTALGTPLSNFEANSNYKEVLDYSIIVKFPLILENVENDLHGAYALVWTTTPWTLPANLILCINKDYDYVLVLDDTTEEKYLLAKGTLASVFKKKKPKILQEYKGCALARIKYKPLFTYYENYGKTHENFRIYWDNFVRLDSGTGIVHCAPAFGADDHRVCIEHGVLNKFDKPPMPLDDNGNYTKLVSSNLNLTGRYIKDCETDIVTNLKERGLLFRKAKEKHPYPFCWRSDTPLIYRVCDCWFINVEKIRHKLVANNHKSTWVPANVRDGRFGNWLQGSVDWCVSRNRYWGTPIPLWVNPNDPTDIVCVGSIQELANLTGQEPEQITNLHRHHIDHLTIPSKKHPGQTLCRTESVFDCWFESGSMPFAQNHFPFEKGDNVQDPKFLPADFIAEGMDQTRGWFYTLLVLSSALYDRPAFKNVIVNGIVLNKDGEKMSKRKKNYPEPSEILDEFGADALRLYLLKSPVIRGMDLQFNKEHIREIVRKYHMMIYNVTKFYFEMISIYEKQHKTKYNYTHLDLKGAKPEILDIWILQCLDELIQKVDKQMETYRLVAIPEMFLTFIDQLSRWYLKLNKKRFKDPRTNKLCLDVQSVCLYRFAQIIAPFTPFIAESLYLAIQPKLVNNGKTKSIHFTQIPKNLSNVGELFPSGDSFIQSMQFFQEIMDALRSIRTKRSNPSIKVPLKRVILVHPDGQALERLAKIQNSICAEANINEIEWESDESLYVVYDLKLDIDQIKQRLKPKERKQIGIIQKTLGNSKQVNKILGALKDPKTTKILIEKDVYVQPNELTIVKQPCDKQPCKIVCCKSGLTIVADDTIDQELMEVFYVKTFIRKYQNARKDAGLQHTDEVRVSFSTKSALLAKLLLEKYHDYIKEQIGPILDVQKDLLYCTNIEIDQDISFNILLKK